MAWELLEGAPAVVKISAAGILSWNSETQSLLGYPDRVMLWYDVETSQLRICRVAAWEGERSCMAVELKKEMYLVYAKEHLTIAGILPQSPLELVPQFPIPEPGETNQTCHGYVWVDLP